MSSHSLRISKTLKQIRQFQEMISQNDSTDYDHGVYNGIEYVMSVLSGINPEYIKFSMDMIELKEIDTNELLSSTENSSNGER